MATPPVLGSLQLSSNLSQLPSSADTPAEGATITVQARDTTGVVMPGVVVALAAPTARLSAATATTDTTGQARVTLTTDGNPANRSLSLSGSSGSVSAPALTVPVVGTSLAFTTPALIAADVATPFSVRLTDAAGDAIPNAVVSLSSNGTGSLSAASGTTNTSGVVSASLTAAGTTASLSASALGASASSSVAVARDLVSFVAPTVSAFDLGTGPVTVTVRVQRNGADVADGFAVAFATTRGSLSAASATTVGGRASVQLNPADAGLAVVTATGGAPTQATASTTLNFRNVDQLRFTSPVAGSGFEVGSPITLSVAWQRNGTTVPNGTVVRFTATRGTLASPTAVANGGVASVTYTGTSVGDADISAVGAVTEAPAASLRLSLRDTSTVALGFTAPTVDNTVVEQGSSVPVTVNVRRNGGNAPDGTIVNFSTTAGTLSASTATTVGGLASVNLSSSRAAAATVTATADVFGRQASDLRRVAFRVPPARLQVLVPAYFYPTASGSPWDRLLSTVEANKSVTLNVILKQADTLFAVANADHLSMAARFQARGGRVLAHLPTGAASGSPSIDQLKASVDAYIAQYGTVIGGFYFDNMSTTAAGTSFYSQLYLHIKNKNAAYLVVGNSRGALPATEAYTATTDALVAYEGKAATYLDGFASRAITPWQPFYANTNFAVLAQDVATCGAMQSLLQTLITPKANAGLLYVTNDGVGASGTEAPYDTLPSYWEVLIQAVDFANKGATLPSCGG